MEFTCMACGRKHIRDNRLVDEHIHCKCGFDFYAFYNQGLSVAIPSDEITNQASAAAFRRFVISTRRCLDAKVEPVTDYISYLNKADPIMLMRKGLERYQEEVFGKLLLYSGDVVSICESLKKHQDVLIKNKGKYIDIVEIRQKVKEKSPGLREPINYLNEEPPLKDWQKDVMEQDAARTGYLFGDVI